MPVAATIDVAAIASATRQTRAAKSGRCRSRRRRRHRHRSVCRPAGRREVKAGYERILPCPQGEAYIIFRLAKLINTFRHNTFRYLHYDYVSALKSST